MTNHLALFAEGQGGHLSVPVASMAAVMRCLAHAPRLPPLDWGPPCQHLLNLATSPRRGEHSDSHSQHQTANSTDADAEGADSSAGLGPACLLLALEHGGVASHGLGEWLDQLMTQQGFSQLPAQLQQMLLTGLPEVVQALSSQRSADVVSTLSMLSMLSSNSNRQHAGWLSIAVWTGLLRLLHSAQDSNSNSSTAPPTAAVSEAAQRSVAQLLQQLPLPPFLLPGELLPQPSIKLDDALRSVTDGGVAQAPTSAERGHSSSERRTDAQQEEEGWKLQTWGAACACLQLTSAQKVRGRQVIDDQSRLMQLTCMAVSHHAKRGQ